MGDDGGNGIAAKILAEVLDIGSRLGGVEVECRTTVEHLRSIDTRLQTGSTQMKEHGTMLALQGERLATLQHRLDEQEAESLARRRRCSEQFRRLGTKFEDTGKHVIQMHSERTGMRTLAKAALAVLGLLVAIFGALHLERCYESKVVAASTYPVDAGQK